MNRSEGNIKMGQQVLTKADGGGQVVAADAVALMEVISRAAGDPNTDVNKLERLMGMYERITAARAKAAFDAALSSMQPKLPSVDRRGSITIRDKSETKKIIQSTPYALFEDINEAIKPVMAEHGFAISFRTGSSAEGKILVTAILSHKDGHREETTLTLTHDSTGSKNAVQAIGSSVSYGKRYTMCALLNITTKGEDDDAVSVGDKITEEQLEELSKLLTETKADLRKFLEYMGVDAIFNIPAAKFAKAKQALETKKAKAHASS